MRTTLPAFVLAILLALAGGAAIAQTATPTPTPRPTPAAQATPPARATGQPAQHRRRPSLVLRRTDRHGQQHPRRATG